MSTPASLRRIEKRLADTTRAELRLDQGYRRLYATDASLYQIEPRGVVIPRVAEDVPEIVAAAAEEGVAILPRGAATSLSGQTVGDALVIDFSKHLNRVGIVDRDRLRVHVEPGVVLDQLNARLAPLGLMFAPEVSTGDRATIGGMIGNNSAGARSLRYGKTVDHVEAIDAVLDDGTTTRFAPLEEHELESICANGSRVGALHRAVRDEVAAHESAIRARFPRILRRVSGYNLDEFVPGLPVRPVGWVDEPWRFNLSRLIVGSEGTLAVVAGADLKLVPLPKASGLVVLSFATLGHALAGVGALLEAGPSAVEMLDRMILELAAQQPVLSSHLGFVRGEPEAVLAAQIDADSTDEVNDRAATLMRIAAGLDGVLGVCDCCSDPSLRSSFWKVRKAGLALLMGMVGDAKPVAFVEDTAVAPEKLGAFCARFLEIVSRHGARASVYGHADVGCLHIRPILDLKRRRGVVQLRGISRHVAALVAEFEGAMSGEHGDGLARSRWNRVLFGEEVHGVMRRVKSAFDPRGLLNPEKVVGEPHVDASLRISPDYHTHEPAETGLDFSSQHGFARAAELCSGVGACRKATGIMCPSYMVTLEEEHTTRGRANALRLALSGQLPGGLSDETLHEALDLCLQCKACKAECPSNVDLAKLKSETIYQSHRADRVPLPDLALAHLDRLYALGALLPGLANGVTSSRLGKWLLEKAGGIDARRTLPPLAPETLRHWFRRRQRGPRAGERGKVVLFDDCFTNYNSPEVGRAAVKALEAAGYAVELAGGVCCGRPAISKGVLDRAKSLARENVARLVGRTSDDVWLVGCEPSCLLTFVDEYREFRLGPDANRLATRAVLVDTFLADRARVPEPPLRPLERPALLHGHCQQRALVGAGGSLALLERVPGLRVRLLDSGCCGMAGSFGYERGHYDVSTALAERVLLPACQAEPDAVVAAPGFSCRSQLKDLGGIRALHPVQIFAEQLGE